MQSAEPETMPEKVRFSQSVFAEGAVEHWLFRIQEMMIKSLYDLTKDSLLCYPENPFERKAWLFNYAAQPILTVDLIKWTEGCTDAILKTHNGYKNGVKDYFEFMKILITKMVQIVRENLNTLERTLMGALIVLDVHARDVVGDMVKVDVKNLNDFEWSKQLRYYWDPEEDNCIVRQTNTRF
jgi:dynein heavy chain